MKSVKESGFDPAEDLRQVGLRLEVIRYLALIVIVLLLGRLWYLQVMNSEVYAERSDKNRTRILPIPARRGTIFDRKGRILVTSQPSYNIVLSRKDIKEKDFPQIANLLVKNLAIEQKWLANRFEAARFEAKYEFIVVKELATAADVAWVRAHQYEYPMIRAEEAPQRLYPFGLLAAHALGYVGEVSPDELKDKNGPFSYENGYKLGDIIGKSGVERSHNEILMGKDGELRVLVDSRGRIQKVLDKVEPVAGRDLYTTLDLDIQKVAEVQTETMPAKRGAIVVAEPSTGEILAMVSRPAFDPNLFSQRAKTPQGKGEIRELQNDEDRPLYNRVIQGQFPPGSTWKLFTTTAALNENVITPESSRVQDGDIQLGNYLMHSLSHMGMPDIVTAIQHSCDGYFYRLGLKMGPERFEKWVNIFRFGQRTGIDLPGEYSGIPPTPTRKAAFAKGLVKSIIRKRCEAQGLTGEPKEKCEQTWTDQDNKMLERESRFTDYDMASSAFGQGQNALTPIQLLRYAAALGNGGQMHTPHLLLKANPGIDRNGNRQPEATYTDKNYFTVPMAPPIHEIVLQGMWRAVNAGGTGGAAAVEGFDVCGKTGTAQVTSNDRMTKATNDHAWFISFAPRDKPELAMVVLTENAGRGGRQSAPRAKAIYDDYYRRTRNLPAAEPLAAATPEGAKAGAAGKGR